MVRRMPKIEKNDSRVHGARKKMMTFQSLAVNPETFVLNPAPYTLYLIPFPHPTCLYKILPTSLSTGIGNILKTREDDRVPFLSAENALFLKLSL